MGETRCKRRSETIAIKTVRAIDGEFLF